MLLEQVCGFSLGQVKLVDLFHRNQSSFGGTFVSSGETHQERNINGLDLDLLDFLLIRLLPAGEVLHGLVDGLVVDVLGDDVRLVRATHCTFEVVNIRVAITSSTGIVQWSLRSIEGYSGPPTK